ncbi:MAG: glycosyltransferase family 4 protein, partial [Jaaginema sp. PMC 1079.18]|nr:glycosyltransferase family 4 protein [Jaaginema sp. PMC 1079.18]
IKQFSPDIVSLHSSKAGILGRLACFFLNQPCIFTAHGWAFTEGVPKFQKNIYRFLEQKFEFLASRIICVSEYDRNLGIAAGMNPDRIVTIHNGMPDIPNALHANPCQSDPVQMVMVARMDTQKDHTTLIQAISEISNIKLQLVGDGPKKTTIQTQVNSLGLSHNVEFLGYREDIAHILAKTQIFLLISNWEGFPCTTLEAMRAGLPVIVSNVGGASEALIEGKTGYCIPKGDVATLRERILTLVNNPDLRQQMGQAARKHYEENFTFEQMFQKTFAIYESVLANHHNKP